MNGQIRLVAALAATAWLAACDGGRQATYPRDWPDAMPAAKQGVHCADLSGRYAMADGVLALVFPRPSGPGDHGIHWHTLEIVADGSGRHELNFYGNGVDDDYGVPPNRSTRPLQWTSCHQGWLRRDLRRDEGRPLQRAEGDERSVERYLLLARDAGGNLIAQEVIERYQSISLWAPGGADLRVPFTGSTDRQWSRWLAATGEPALPRANPLARDDAPVLRTLGRRLPPDVEVLSRRADGDAHVVELGVADASQLALVEERLLSSAAFGEARVVDSQRRPGGGIVVTVIVGPPRPAAPSAAEVARVAAATAQREQQEAMLGRVFALLRPCSSANLWEQRDDGHVLEVRCPDEESLSVFLGNLRASPRFGIPELRRTEPYVGRQVTAWVFVRER